MSKEIEKPIKAYICIIVGLLLSAMVGQPNVITIPVTAILVLGTGQSASRQGIRKYMARRVLIQLLDSAIIVTTLWLLQRFTPLGNDWVTVLLTLAISFPFLMYLDYRLKVSPMYITTIAVSGLVLVTGSSKQWSYPLIRIFLVALGCALGYALSLWIFPRDRAKIVRQALERGITRLLDTLTAAVSSDQDTQDLPQVVSATREVIQSVDGDLIPLLADRGGDASVLWLDHLQRSFKTLQQLAVFWQERGEGLPADAALRSALLCSFALHRRLLSGETENGPLPDLPSASGHNESVLLGAVIVYRETLEELLPPPEGIAKEESAGLRI